MSWMEKLYQTYEAAVLLDEPPPSDDDKKKHSSLVPISHTQQNAHINITLDGMGNFITAVVLKEKTQVVLPATEDSAGRVGTKPPPHPLADKLQYVAKDYFDYGGKKACFFKEYHAQLEKWCTSDYAHPKVKAVLQYIEKGTVIKDLVTANIVYVDADNVLLTQWNSDNGEAPALFKLLPKDKGVLDQGSALVCWSVELASDPVMDTWKDESIQQSWIAYYASSGSNAKGLCYITGQTQTLAMNHPKKIRHSGDGAKLISSNDWQGFTFLGRFTDDKKNVENLGLQSVGVGVITTQKAHNALSWLIQKGFKNGDQVYVSWAVSGKAIPEPLQDSLSQFDDDPDLSEIDNTQESAQTALDYSTDLGAAYALKLKKYMAGYAAKLEETEQIIIMGLDSATPGRMGILYYRELLSREFLERLEKWHTEFAWYQRHTQEIKNDTGKKPKIKVIFPISSPVSKDIAVAAYGDNVTDNLKKKVIERLMPCIIDDAVFPNDLLDSCVRKAINRVGYASDKQWLWEKNLGITCALYKGYWARYSKPEERRIYTMALDENYHARDYLYGRLLAVAERIEEIALSVTEENRPTNAARLMQRFADHPFKTWLLIYKALDPYMQRLQVSRTGFLNNQREELETIMAAFSIEDFNNPAPLSGEFLLGYYCQRQKMRDESAESKKRFNEKKAQESKSNEINTLGEPK